MFETGFKFTVSYHDFRNVYPVSGVLAVTQDVLKGIGIKVKTLYVPTSRHKMDLLVLTRVYPPYGFGGLALHLKYLYEEIASRDHQITILSGVCEGFNRVEMPKESNHENITIHEIEFGFREGHYVLYPIALRLFLRNFDTTDFDAVMAHTPVPFEFEQPVIAKYHDFNRRERDFVRQGMPLWMKTGESILNRIRPIVDKKAMSASDHLIFISNLLYNSWEEFYEITTPRTIIHNGVDTGTFYPRNSNQSEDYILFVTGSGDGQKDKLETSGVLDFARKTHFDVHVAGRSEIEDPNVTALGRFTQEKLAAIYSEAAVTIHPSRFEAFGNVVLESLACGTPVVTSKNVGANEILDPKCGVVTNNLEDGVKKAMNLDPKYCVEKARRHTWDKVADETLGVVESYTET